MHASGRGTYIILDMNVSAPVLQQLHRLLVSLVCCHVESGLSIILQKHIEQENAVSHIPSQAKPRYEER